MDDVDSIWQILRALDRAAKLQRRASAATGYGQAALGVLNAAAFSPDTPGALARNLALPPQTVTRAIAELEADQLIRRREDPRDGRSYTVELTAAGHREVQRFRRGLSDRFAAHLVDWAPQEVQAFASRLDALVDALAQDAPHPPTRARCPNPWRETQPSRPDDE